MEIEFTKSGAGITEQSENDEEWPWCEISRVSIVAKSALNCIVRYLAVENRSGAFVEISSDNPSFQSSLRQLTELGAVDDDVVKSVSTLLPPEGRVSLFEGTES